MKQISIVNYIFLSTTKTSLHAFRLNLIICLSRCADKDLLTCRKLMLFIYHAIIFKSREIGVKMIASFSAFLPVCRFLVIMPDRCD